MHNVSVHTPKRISEMKKKYTKDKNKKKTKSHFRDNDKGK